MSTPSSPASSSRTLRSKLSPFSSPSGSSSSFFNTLSSKTRTFRASTSASSFRPSLDGSVHETDHDDDRSEPKEDEMDRIMGRLIWQAGVDEETRPIICVDTSQLPDPKSTSYDTLLVRIVSTLHLYVEQDYVIVLFAAGSRNSPGWKWIWGAYQKLGRTFRKNLKRLYIVHPSFFSKMLFTLASPLISPKFFRKLIYTSTLSSLATHLPLQQLLIPAETLKENLKHEPSITFPTVAPSLQFGVPLEELMGSAEPYNLPRVVRDAVTFLRWEEGAMEAEGLFRKSGSAGVLRNVGEGYNRGSPIELASYQDPHLAAVLIKKFFREMNEPLFPSSTYELIGRCPKIPTTAEPDEEVVRFIKDKLFAQLSQQAQVLLGYVLHLFHDVAQLSTHNLMTSSNLAIVFTPNLLNSPSPQLDVKLASLPSAASSSISSFFATSTPPSTSTPPTTPKKKVEQMTTLGEIIRFCIDHPVEVFGPLEDESEGQGTLRAGGEARGGEGAEGFAIGEDEEESPISPSSSSNIQVSPSRSGKTKGGSISISRLTSRPSTGGVETRGVMAKEFFSAPGSSPKDGLGKE